MTAGDGTHLVPVRSILNRTGGFLAGYTHTLNPYRGCGFGGAACGVACYASELRHGDERALRWGTYLRAKADAAEHYLRQARAERRAGRPLRIYMASVTDPYVPQEARFGVTRALLEAMATEPPDVLTLQTHTPGPAGDLPRLLALRDAGAAVHVQISVETDTDDLPGFPRPASPVRARLDALAAVRAAGLPAVCVVAPLLPVADVPGFAAEVARAADAAILDHYLLGDGSKDGARTKRRRSHADPPLPERLPERWRTLEAFEDVLAAFRDALGDDRVGVSREGFARFARPAR